MISERVDGVSIKLFRVRAPRRPGRPCRSVLSWTQLLLQDVLEGNLAKLPLPHICDVRDIALAHIRAAELPDAKVSQHSAL